MCNWRDDFKEQQPEEEEQPVAVAEETATKRVRYYIVFLLAQQIRALSLSHSLCPCRRRLGIYPGKYSGAEK